MDDFARLSAGPEGPLGCARLGERSALFLLPGTTLGPDGAAVTI